MKGRIAHTACILACVASALIFSACSGAPKGTGGNNSTEWLPSLGGGGNAETGVHPSVQGVPDRLTHEEEKIVRFSDGAPTDFYAADGYSNGGMFNCTWRARNAVIAEGKLSVSVSQEGGGYAGGEYRSRGYYSYGFYSVCMKAADCSGVISSFFTYVHNRDEIDIEFLGKDTTHVQFNYYLRGAGGHEYWYDLGFDGAADFHEYAFDWQPDSITWYVDGKAVYRVFENIPTTDTQIMMNVWNAKGQDGWSGALDAAKLPATAEYRWIGYKAD